MNFIPLMSPNILEQDIEAVSNVLRSGMLVQGRKVAELEEAVSNYLGIKNVVAVSNGTATLHLALLALGVGVGDEVIVPAFSYVATANVVEIVGASCVFVDIEPDTFNIDISKIDQAITSRTKAIIPVHEFGLASNIGEIVEFARNRKLFVIEDAACALGATENGKFVGTFGDVGSFSLHPRKAVTSGEGGLLTTHNDKLAEKFRILRNHGIEMQNDKMNFVAAGYNYRMTDFQAALVSGQFSRIEESLNQRDKFAKLYLEALDNISAVQLPAIPKNKRHTWQTFHLVLNDKINRDQMISDLKDKGIGTNYGAQCIPYQEFYLKKYNLDCETLFPNALRAYKKGLALPMFEKLNEIDVKTVCETLIDLLGRNGETI